jgi:hypothetical protein
MDLVVLSRKASNADKRNFLLDNEDKKEQAFDSEMDAAIEDAGRPFGGSYFVPMHGKSPDHWPKNPKHRFQPS